MFQILGNVVSRFWLVFLVGWGVVFAALWWLAPAFQDVAVDREFGFMPESVPSRTGME
jgi:hypothetical protein